MITFIFPIYKQEHILEKSVELLEKHVSKKLNEDYEIIICIDGSPDNCRQISDNLAKRIKSVKSIGYNNNKGRGHALKYSGLYAKGDFIIYMDCDLVVDKYLTFIDEMIEKIKKYDIVIASRFLTTSNCKRKWQRKIVSKCYRILVAIVFRSFNVRDPDVGFKGFKKDCFQYINLMSNLNGASWDLQFLISAHYEGYKIFEFPFHYEEDYSTTTVNIFFYSFIELLGLLYIRLTTMISKYVIF
jgi:glycosyltransferase involved in cell wall biosynthesis